MAKILCFSSVLLQHPNPEPFFERLRQAGHEVIADPRFMEMPPSEVLMTHLPGAAALLSGGYPVGKEYLEVADRLEVISHLCSGYDQLDLDLLRDCGIVVTNVLLPEMAHPVSDLAIGLMFALAREIPRYDRLLKNGGYERGWGSAVTGTTLGVIGLGMVGRDLLARFRGLFGRVLVHTRTPDFRFAEKWDLQFAPLEQVLAESDFVSLHLRYAPETHHLLGAGELALMKPGAFVVNTARFPLIDPEALWEALRGKRIAGAGLDFGGENPQAARLGLLDNVILLPHLGNRVPESSAHVIECGIRNALDVLNNTRPRFMVNPEVWADRKRR